MTKSNTLPAVLLVTAGAIALYGFAKSQAVQTLNYYLAGISAGYDDYTPVIQLMIGVQNPGNENFSVKAVVGNLSSDGTHIGTVSSFQQIVIPGPGEVKLPLNIRIDLAGIALDVYNMITNGIGNSRSIKFDGYINGNGIVVPITVSEKLF